MRLSLIGSGKLGQQLYNVFSACPELELVQWMIRSGSVPFSTEGVSIAHTTEELVSVDCFLLAVTDASIKSLSTKLPKNSLVVHTSGATDLTIFPKHHRKGVFYPIQSFSEGRKTNFSALPIGIEASNANDLQLLEKLATAIQANPVRLDSSQRKVIHLSAVLVNNFTNHLFTAAAQLCKQHQLPFELLKPLIQETVAKLDTLHPSEAQTGPALREDQHTIDAHLSILEHQELRELYQHFTNLIINHYKQ